MNQKGEYVIWFTGLSGSGKTTISRYFANELRKRHKPFVLLDGDIVRKTLSGDLGYSKHDRNKHILRVAHMSYLVSANNVLTIACVISPSRKIRRYARHLIGKYFIEVYVKCSIDTCRRRDVKGHWDKVEKGIIKDFVGYNIPYDEPQYPEIILNTDRETVMQSVQRLVNYLERKRII